MNSDVNKKNACLFTWLYSNTHDHPRYQQTVKKLMYAYSFWVFFLSLGMCH